MAALAYLNDEKNSGNNKSPLDVQKNAFEKKHYRFAQGDFC